MDNRIKLPRGEGVLILIVIFLVGACQIFAPAQESTIQPSAISSQPSDTPMPSLEGTQPEGATPVPTPAAPDSAALPVFAVYRETRREVQPAIVHEPIAAGLGNVRNPFVLSEEHLQRLAQDGFVVSPGVEKEFFTLYEKARYDNLPVFVTSDSLLHVYHLLFDKVLRTAEVERFIPLLHDLNESLLAESDREYQALVDTPWEDAALRTVAFVSVGSRLLDPAVETPAYAGDLVEAELALVEAASGFVPSPIFPGLEFGEDYTQYIPRGHYTRSDALKAYFKSMMWYGRMTFRLKTNDPEAGRAETRSALLLAQALRSAEVDGRPALDAWTDLYSPTVFFVGRSDDLTALQYFDVMDSVYGTGVSAGDLVDEAKLDQFIELADLLPPPRILGIVIMDTDEEEAVTKGMRLMGQRFVPDAYIFRQLIYRNVGTREHRRGLPMGLDIPAAMGSERAYAILDELGETAYENYPSQMEKMRAWTSSLTVADWTETLYNTWLYSFYPLMEVPGEGYPAFMRSTAWLDKQLNAVLGSWAELKHDTILYAKQVYAELGAGPPPPPPVPPRGYVEPVPGFYARLAALTAMTREGLESRGLLNELDGQSLSQLEDLALELQGMAEKELRGEPLTDDEDSRIRYYGGELENLTMAAADSDLEDPYAPRFMEEEPQAAVVADVATDPDPGVVLEEAVGRVNPIYVVVPIVAPDGSSYLQVNRGGVFSYYEFPWPMNDRLTDEKWREMLDAGEAPPPPEWTGSFFIQEDEYDALNNAIFGFQQGLTNAYWYQSPDYFPEAGEALAGVRSEIEGWLAEKRYLGHQLLASTVRSFDLQSEDRAVVTVRETWRDSLYEYEGDYPFYEEEPVAERGPYDLDVAYTLERVGGEAGSYWQVTNAVYANQPPDW